MSRPGITKLMLPAAACALCLVAAGSARAQLSSRAAQQQNSPITNAITQTSRPNGGTETNENIEKKAIKELNDADPRVRVEGVRSLREDSDAKADTLIIRSLNDPDPRVKIKAADVIGARQNAAAVPLLTQLLVLRSTEPAVKLHLAAALGRIGDDRATKAVINYLYESRDERSRGMAVFALGEIGDPAATDVLSTAATEDQDSTVRRLAQEALEKIDGELPTHHKVVTAAQMPTDQRLAKLREIDEKLHEHDAH